VKKEATPKCKGLKLKTSDKKEATPTRKGTRTDHTKRKATNHYLINSSFANLMLEGECDASRLYLKRETSIENRIRVISKMKSNKPLPHRRQLRQSKA
jgi:hypothetical protein